MADYYLCDICESKCFYDANLNWEWSEKDAPIPEDEMVRGKHLRLGYCGDMAAICLDCAKTHEVIVVEIAAPQPSDAYRMAIDTGLVCAHLGVTNPEDDYETARKKLNDLICWSVQVDRDLGQPSDDAKDALVEALEVLAKLGNGEHYGNSDGNVIAQRALAAYRAAQEKK